MPDFTQLQLSRDPRGVVTISIDVPDAPMNVFNDAVVRELAEVVSLLEREPARAVVFRSAKASGFFAGADVHRIRRLESQGEAGAVQSIGQELFDRIERLPCPTVAVIHGVCLGGGLEFALACKFRVARDDAVLPQRPSLRSPGGGDGAGSDVPVLRSVRPSALPSDSTRSRRCASSRRIC